MIIREHIRFNKDIKEALFNSLVFSFDSVVNSRHLSTFGLDLCRNSILNDLEKKYIRF